MTTLLQKFIKMRPCGGFGMIMADVPWSYNMRSEKGYGRAPEAHYPTMSLAEIKEMPVEALAAPDCVLWLWALNPQLPQALEVVDAWGFTFKTSGHWAKVGASGKQHFGTGYLLRNAGEPFIIATRGAPKTSRAVRSVVIAPVREHSRKPDEAFEAAEKMMPDVQRIELFSRQRRKGWTVWGNETEKFAATA